MSNIRIFWIVGMIWSSIVVTSLWYGCEKDNSSATLVRHSTAKTITNYSVDTLNVPIEPLKINVWHADTLGHDVVNITWDSAGYCQGCRPYILSYILVDNPPMIRKGNKMIYAVPVVVLNGKTMWMPVYWDGIGVVQFSDKMKIRFYWGTSSDCLQNRIYTGCLVNVYYGQSMLDEQHFSQFFTFTGPTY